MSLGKRGLLFVVLAGCGHADAEKGTSMSELNRTVQSLKAQNTAYAKQVEELENRVFIMSDQMDGKKEEAPRAAPPRACRPPGRS